MTKEVEAVKSAPPRTPQYLTPEQLRKLAKAHIRQYENRLASDSKYVNRDECAAYLALWKDVEANADKALVGFSKETLMEIQDAIDSGDYDDLLWPDDVINASETIRELRDDDSDPTEAFRKRLSAAINETPREREDLEDMYGQVWDTEQFKADFSLRAFLAPFVFATRKSDGKAGMLVFQHLPRYYFCFQEK